MSATLNESLLVKRLLNDRSVPTLAEILPKEPEANHEDFQSLYKEVKAIRETLQGFAGGNFDKEIHVRGAVGGYLKTLQANLKHLTWQVEQVAKGDLTQRVDFMGDFSRAFNTLTFRLERSMEELKEREANERTQIMLDATPLCCNFWDENMNNVDCNLEAVKLFDLKCKQDYLDRFDELSPEFQPCGRRSRDLAMEKIREAFENGYAKFEWMHCKLNGEPVPAEVKLVRVWQKDHFIVAGYTRDLRELKKTQTNLERERELLLNVLNTSPVCFSVVVDGKVRFATPFMKDFLGTKVGDDLIDCFERRESGDRLLKELHGEKIIHWRPVTLQTKNGEPREMLASLFQTDYYDEQGTMVWLVDVTKIRKVEADLRKAKNKAEESARIKSEFLANMSHEIRTPMNAILGMMHLVRQTELSEKQSIYIETTEKSAKLLLRIINDILDLSKLEAGKLVMESQTFSLRETIHDVLDVVREQSAKKSLQLSVNVDQHIPDSLIGDAGRLKQVLLNLLNNAIKFTSSGSVKLRVSTDHQDASEVKLTFSVQDTGIGVSESQLRRLFTPFTQADSSTTRKFGGTGLGLAISKSLVEMMDGKIWCESRENKGSTFIFTARFDIPEEVKDDSEDEYAMEDDQEKSGIRMPIELQGMPILLAEDNKINQLVATELLKARGFHVDIASNGREALEKLAKNDYGLVLMDIQMPEMDGLETVRRIRANPEYAELPVLAMTANAMSGDRELCIKAGMNDHIAKPIDPITLYKSIIRWAKPKNTKKTV